MAGQQPAVEDLARAFARTASAAFQDQAEFFRSLPDDAWSDPTGCAAWTMHDLAGHIVGEAIWFPRNVNPFISSFLRRYSVTFEGQLQGSKLPL